MEATVSASVPSNQNTALSAQPLNNKNRTQAQEPLRRIPSGAPSNGATQDVHKTVATSQPAPNTQAFWRRSDAVAVPSSPQKTLPEVQDFLQRAYKTAQRSPQNAIAAAHLKAIAPVPPASKISTAIVLDSLQKTWVTTQLPSQTTAAAKELSSTTAISKSSKSTNNSGTTLESEALPVPATNESPQKTTFDTSSTCTKFTGETGTSTKVDQTGAYVRFNKNMQAKPNPRQGQSSPQKRAVLVAKRKQPNLHTKEECFETGQSTEARKVQSSAVKEIQITHSDPTTMRSASVPNETSHVKSPQTTKAPFWNVFEPSQSSPAQAESRSANANSAPNPLLRSMSAPEKTPLSQSPQSSSASSASETSKSKTQSVRASESPSKHGASRVAQTYKLSQGDRGTKDTARLAGQSPKRALAKNQRGQSQGTNGRRHPYQIQDDIDPRKRVLVSGFPPYTQTQDLLRVLTPFGSCHVDKCRNRLAVVSFDSEQSAINAMKASEEICIYGEFIEIKPFTSPRHVEEMFKAYKKVITTKKGQDIIQPNQIDLSGDFYQQANNIQNAIRLTKEQVEAVSNLYKDLEMVLQQEWPGCVAIPFGSIPTGLGIKSSDADCYVELGAAGAAARGRGLGGGGAGFVHRARRLLALYPQVFTHLVAIPRANTPILKFRHAPSGFQCDVSAKTPLGAQNSQLIRHLLAADPRLAPLALLAKYWARVHELSGTGRLTNYALVMMLVFYLQRVRLAPPVVALQRARGAQRLVDQWDAGFAPPPPPPPPPPAAAPLALPQLFGGFFQFYASFDFDSLCVCPFLGEPVPKALFASPHALPPEFARYVANVRDNLASPIRHGTPFCVQDPFEQSHNVASAVSPRLAADIRAYFRYAAEAYAADGDTFLRTALLTRPALRRERTTPTTKLVLLPRVRGHIRDPDWRARLRNILLDLIFDDILQIKLKRELEKEEAERIDEEKKEAERIDSEGNGKTASPKKTKPKVDREKYSGSATKPVWRRKKNYSAASPEPSETLVRRQRAATEHILESAEEVRLQFELELGFKDEPRSLYLFSRLLDGELETFSGFVKFIHTALFDWFRMLVRPHLALPAEPERAAGRRDCSIQFECVRSDTRPKVPDARSKEPDTRPKEPDTRLKEPDTRLKEPDTRPKEPDTRLKEPDTRLKEPDTRPKEPNTRPKKPDTPPDDPADLSKDVNALTLGRNADTPPEAP